ncbi:hypothetical protein [Acidisarcina polymorpha]|nr:hypothetical protein [Acidisarcina polymorpha]
MRENIVRALYSDDRPIIISESEERTQLSLFLMSLVMQRPLATRLSLSFCTGALSYLEANSVPIRIQAMPSRIARMVRDEVHLLHGEEEPLVSEWAKWLVKDLKRKDIVLEELFAPFDNTSQTYEEPESVAIIRKLSEARVLFQCAHDGSQTAEDVLRGVTTLFPDGETQVPFKNALVGELAKTSSQRNSLVRVLFDSEEIAFALQESKSSLLSVASLLAKQDPTLALNLLNDVLFRPYKNKVQQDLVHFLLSEIQLLAAEPTRPLETQVLFAIAREQKELISRPGFWLLQRSFDESIELAETLAEDLDDELVLAGLLAAGRFDLLVRILRMRGAQGAREALSLARSLKLNDSSEYQKVLALRGEVLDFAQTLAWGEAYSMRPLNEAQLFILASSSVEPHRLVALAPDISIWLNALSALPSEPQRMFAIAVFLACGEEFAEGWRLLRKSFDVIHQSTGSKTIPSEWWGLVKSRLPTLAVWEKWDKCERLRRGAVDSILRAGLPESMVEQVSQDRTLQQRLREIYRNRR